MMSDYDFEKAFSDYLEQKEYDEAQAALFSVIRVAFHAGYLAGLNQKKVVTFDRKDTGNMCLVGEAPTIDKSEE